MTAPPDPRLGSRLAGYRIQSPLGRGGMGVVYLAEQLGPRRLVALKLLSAPVATSEAFRERFLRESELAAAIDHPNVLPVYDAGETDGVLWIAMRYVDGIDLAALVERDGPLAPEQALAISGQVAGALDAAHARGLVHRDVKPANILLAMEEGAPSHAWLADFGLTRRVGGARGVTVSGQVLGTIDYVAPEQVEGGPVDGRADQYALGCVLFECLTGEVPFRRDTELAVLWAHVHDPPPRLGEHRPDLPAALDAAVGRALAKAPGDRYPSCEAMVAAAQGALAGIAPAPVRRRPGRPARGPAGGGRRWPRAPVLAAVAAALVTVVLAVTILVARDDRAPGAAPAEAVVPAANQVVRIDPDTYQVAGSVAVGPSPAAVAAGGGAVWVANRGDGTVTEIVANRAQQPFPAGGSGPIGPGGPGVAFANGSLWVVNTERRLVVRVPPDTDSTPISVPMSPVALAAAQGNVWVAGRTPGGGGLVARIVVATNDVEQEVELPHPPSGLAITGDGQTLWVATPGDRSVRKVDTGDGGTVRRIPLPDAPGQVALSDAAAWVTTGGSDTVQRIDPATEEPEAIKVGNGPVGVAFGANRVWVANAQDGTVSVIDPDTSQVGTIHLAVLAPAPTAGEAGTGQLPFRPAAVAAEDRAVWVALAP